MAQRGDLSTESSRSSLQLAKCSRHPTLNAGGNFNYSLGRSVDPTTNQYVNQTVATAPWQDYS